MRPPASRGSASRARDAVCSARRPPWGKNAVFRVVIEPGSASLTTMISGMASGNRRLTSRGRSQSRTSPAATSTRIGVREADDMTPTARMAVGIHQRRPEPKRERAQGEAPSRAPRPARSDAPTIRTARVSPKRSTSTAPLNCRNGRTWPTWSKMLNCGSLLDDRKRGHCCSAGTRASFMHVLDRASVPNDGENEVVNEDEAEEERRRLQHGRPERHRRVRR